MKSFLSATNRGQQEQAAAELLEVVPALMRTIRAEMRSRAARELTVVQFRTLAFLDRHPGASLTDLKDHIGLSLPSASKLVQGLLTRGFLHRADDPADRRRNVLVATPRGRRVLEAARAHTRQSLARRMTSLNEHDLQILRAALLALRPVFLSESDQSVAPHIAVQAHGNGQRPGRRRPGASAIRTSAARTGAAPGSRPNLKGHQASFI